MRTHEIKPPAGAHRASKRVGRGNGSQGTFSGRGVKGQKARAGGGVPAWFEGGQMPLQRRLPKRGFNRTRFQVEVQTVNLVDLARFPDESTFDRDRLAGIGLVDFDGGPIKLLGRGTIDRVIIVEVDAVSAGARRKVEASGGSVRVPEA